MDRHPSPRTAASRFVRTIAGLLIAGASALAAAQDFPSRPVRFVVSYPAGGGVDTMARLVAPAVSARLGQPVIVENRPGGGGALATGAVAKSPPDGYTVLVTGDAPVTQVPLLSRTPYDPYKDLIAVAKGVTVPTAIVVAAASPHRTLAELLAHARKNPGTVSYGTPGNGSAMHAELETLKERAKVDITHVPYKGAPPIVADTLGGQITIGAPGLPVTIPQIRAGQLRLLAVWSPARVPLFPDVPTVQEVTGDAALTGLPTWYGFLLPGGTPREIVARIEEAILGALKDAEVARRLADAGATVVAQPSAAFDASNREQTAQFAAIFQRLGMKQE
ncbi:MAG TPA: tripartite tricarboxylate transporter substrate binding protein [Burkholderiaceae bacterium]|nr:tripartite tricarboxylate transporter substrate binding protein [Burkholderiaceae bacterium]